MGESKLSGRRRSWVPRPSELSESQQNQVKVAVNMSKLLSWCQSRCHYAEVAVIMPKLLPLRQSRRHCAKVAVIFIRVVNIVTRVVAMETLRIRFFVTRCNNNIWTDKGWSKKWRTTELNHTTLLCILSLSLFPSLSPNFYLFLNILQLLGFTKSSSIPSLGRVADRVEWNGSQTGCLW